jgi:hypothetical protein
MRILKTDTGNLFKNTNIFIITVAEPYSVDAGPAAGENLQL